MDTEFISITAQAVADELIGSENVETRMARTARIYSLLAGLAYGVTLAHSPEHFEECDEDHSPAAILELVASLAPERNGIEEQWQEAHEEYWQHRREREAESLTSDVPDTLHVSDILNRPQDD